MELSNVQAQEDNPVVQLTAKVKMLESLLCGVLWHYRHQEPSLSAKITDEAAAGMAQSLEFTKQQATVKILDGQGYQIVVMVDQGGNAIVPVENNEADFDRGARARRIQSIRDTAPQMAHRIKAQAITGEFSSSEINELCDALLALAAK